MLDVEIVVRGLDPRIPLRAVVPHLSEMAGTSPAMTNGTDRPISIAV
jgi:hypothetical protein